MAYRDLKQLDAVSPSDLLRRSVQAQHAAAVASRLVGERGASTLAALVAQGALLSDAATTALGEVHYAELTEPLSAAALLEVEGDVALLACVRDALKARVDAFLEGAAPVSAERVAASELGRAGWPTPLPGRETMADWIARTHAVAVGKSRALVTKVQGPTVVIDPNRPVGEILAERERLPSFEVPASLAEVVFRRAASDTRGGRPLDAILAGLPQFDPQTSAWPVARDFVEAAARKIKKLPEVRVFLRYATEQLAVAGSTQGWASPAASKWAARDMLVKAADNAGILKDVWATESQAASVAYWATLDR